MITTIAIGCIVLIGGVIGIKLIKGAISRGTLNKDDNQDIILFLYYVTGTGGTIAGTSALILIGNIKVLGVLCALATIGVIFNSFSMNNKRNRIQDRDPPH